MQARAIHWVWLVAVFLAGALRLWADDSAARRLSFKTNDVVVFLGGANVVGSQETGHLETLLTLGSRGLGVRYRNLGWEADTVYEQPRELNFPTLRDQLDRVQATVLFMQFGQAESLQGRAHLEAFERAYEKLLDDLAPRNRRVVLMIPPPFEDGAGLLPDLSVRNDDLAAYAGAIRSIAQRRGCRLIDLFEALDPQRRPGPKATSNGMHLTPRGQALVAHAAAAQLGLANIVNQAGPVDAFGIWINKRVDGLRREIVAKNRLWFHYWRPMNWAFLAGDRTEQPSSRDHRDPSIRWFPSEMEKFIPLIEAAEARIERLADELTLQ